MDSRLLSGLDLSVDYGKGTVLAFDEDRTDALVSIGVRAIDVAFAFNIQTLCRAYNREHKVKSFSYLDQFLTLAFAQLTYRAAQKVLAGPRARMVRLFVEPLHACRPHHIRPQREPLFGREVESKLR